MEPLAQILPASVPVAKKKEKFFSCGKEAEASGSSIIFYSSVKYSTAHFSLHKFI